MKYTTKKSVGNPFKIQTGFLLNKVLGQFVWNWRPQIIVLVSFGLASPQYNP